MASLGDLLEDLALDVVEGHACGAALSKGGF
jgi:hypothetical protein